MKTIRVTIDESLLAEVDQVTKSLDTTRSAFMREALQLALQQLKIAHLERLHAKGYARLPVEPGEFDVWETEASGGLR